MKSLIKEKETKGMKNRKNLHKNTTSIWRRKNLKSTL